MRTRCLRHNAPYDECECLKRATFQNYWRCEHHPSAIQNFFERRPGCEWDCHEQPLQWHHGGVHPTPKSWGRVRIGV
jgi:hypothetical protein